MLSWVSRLSSGWGLGTQREHVHVLALLLLGQQEQELLVGEFPGSEKTTFC